MTPTARVPPIQLALPAGTPWLPIRGAREFRRLHFTSGADLYDFLRAMPMGERPRLVRLGRFHFHLACDQEDGDDDRFPYHIVGEVHVNIVPQRKKYRPLLAYGYE